MCDERLVAKQKVVILNKNLPVVLICKDKEALGVRGTQRTQALVDALVSVLHLLQHNTHDDDILDCLVLQEVHLHARVASDCGPWLKGQLHTALHGGKWQVPCMQAVQRFVSVLNRHSGNSCPVAVQDKAVDQGHMYSTCCSTMLVSTTR